MPSLLDDPSTRHLWQRVQNRGSYENAAQSFWHHIYTKDIFAHRQYIVDYEDPPIAEEQGQRKVDQAVKVLNSDWGILFVLLFHEIKRNEISNADLETVEQQAYTAAESYCKKHNISKVYSQTSVGSRARFFIYEPGTWRPLDGKPLGDWNAYVEFGDPDGEEYITEKLREIREEGPELPTITWLWDMNRQKYFYDTPLYFIYQDKTKIKK